MKEKPVSIYDAIDDASEFRVFDGDVRVDIVLGAFQLHVEGAGSEDDPISQDSVLDIAAEGILEAFDKKVV